MYKLYTLNNQFLKEAESLPLNFTGIASVNGTKCWYLNGMHHRLDGPAVEWRDGDREYIIEDTYICNNQEQFNLYIDIMKLKGL